MGIIVGERINATRSSIANALKKRDGDRILKEALRQSAAGATHIDVNSGTNPDRELEDLLWLIDTVQGEITLPLSIDSANPPVVEKALGKVAETPLINSISGEKSRLEGMVPLVKDSGASVVALCMDDNGLPEDTEGRVNVARTIYDLLTSQGIEADRIFFDPLVRPISTNPEQADHFLKATRIIMTELEGAHTICGMSNISFGLPQRNHLNRAFLILAMNAGMDSFILDPTEEGVMPAYHATNALLGRDEYCMQYIQYMRSQDTT